MALSIFDIKPTVIDKSLSGKYILIYSKPKVGKTSFAAQLPKNLILATEIGYHAIGGITALPILKWTDFRNVIKELKDPRAHELYDTVTVDTISILADLCEKYICAREGVEKINLVPYGPLGRFNL